MKRIRIWKGIKIGLSIVIVRRDQGLFGVWMTILHSDCQVILEASTLGFREPRCKSQLRCASACCP